MNKKLRKRQPQTFDGFTNDEISAFDTMRETLVQPLVLAHTHLQGDYTVDTDP